MSAEQTSSEFTFQDVVVALAKSWKRPLAVAFLLAAIVGAAMTILRFNWPSYTNYNIGAQLAFEGIDGGRYPNGTAFSIYDIKTAEVLREVYEKNKLAEDGLSLSDFISQVSVRPREGIANEQRRRLRERLAAPGVTFADRDRIEADFQTAVRSLSLRSIEITFSVSTRQPIAKNKAIKVLNDIVQVWARQAIESRGIHRPFDGGIPAALSYPGSDIFELPLPRLAYLYDQASQLRSTIARVRGAVGTLGGAMQLADGSSLSDVEHQLQNLQNYEIEAVLRVAVQSAQPAERAFTIAAIEGRKLAIEAQLAVMDNNQESYRLGSEQINSFFNRSPSEAVPNNSTGPVQSGANQRRDSEVNFNDGAALDRILDLRDRASMSKLLESLVQRRVTELTEKGPLLQTRAGFDRLLGLMSSQPIANGGAAAPVGNLVAEDVKRVENVFRNIMARGRTVVDRILLQRATVSGDLILPVSVANEVEHVGLFREQTIFLAAFSILAGLFVILWFGSALSRVLARN